MTPMTPDDPISADVLSGDAVLQETGRSAGLMAGETSLNPRSFAHQVDGISIRSQRRVGLSHRAWSRVARRVRYITGRYWLLYKVSNGALDPGNI